MNWIYSFVKFQSTEEAQRAIVEMSGFQIENKRLLCKFANIVKYNEPTNNIYIKPLVPAITEGNANDKTNN